MDSTPERPFAGEFLEPKANELQPRPPLTETVEPPAPQDSATQRIFFGPFGLRAGWSLLIYCTMLAVVFFGSQGTQRHTHSHPGHAATIAAAGAGKHSPVLAPTTVATRAGIRNPAPGRSKPIAGARKPVADADEPLPTAEMITGEAITFAVFFFLSCLMAVIERRRLSAFGLGGSHSISRFLTGAAWGLAAMSLLIAILSGSHLLVFDTRLDHGPKIFFWGGIQLFAFLLTGLTEEYMFRGYLQFTLTRGLVCIGNFFSSRRARPIAFWIAALITSAIFVFAHTYNSGEDWIGLFQVFLAGVVFIVALWRTGSLWWAIGFHMSWDWAQSFLYGVPDSGGLVQGRLFATHALGKQLYSGGTVGPEGSVLCVPILLLVIIVLLYTHPSPQPPLEIRSESPFARPPGWISVGKNL